MSIRVFVSGTCKDLEQECRPAVIKAVQLCGGEPVTMEMWDADYGQTADDVCRDKLRESSHFVGVFAYRRGFVPPSASASITEIEFLGASNRGMPMAVFLPKPDTALGLRLKKLARDQSPADREAQQAFLERVEAGGIRQSFEDAMDLHGRVVRKIERWSGGGLRQMAAAPDRAADSSGPIPSASSDHLALGRKGQCRQFNDCLDHVSGYGLTPTCCFLIRSPSGEYGSVEMLDRLVQELEAKGGANVRQFTVCVQKAWRQESAEDFTGNLGAQIQQGWRPPSVEDLASRLRDVLAGGDAVIKILELQRLDGALEAFVDAFWRPLVAALGTEHDHRLIALLDWQGPVEVSVKDLIGAQADTDDYVGVLNNHTIVALDELGEFTERDIRVWYVRRGRSQDDAAVGAKILFDETGGKPLLLYHKLQYA